MNWLDRIRRHPTYRDIRQYIPWRQTHRPGPLLGFHGDAHLLGLVTSIMNHAGAFVETGTQVGATTRWVAAQWPNKPTYSCEINENAHRVARRVTRRLRNVTLYNMASEDFLPKLYGEHPELTDIPVLYWLDAHGHGHKWPLRFEVEFLTSRQNAGALMIDDFLVPGRPEFKFDSYDGQECSLEYIAPSLDKRWTYQVVMPRYAEKSSTAYDPLVGYVAIFFGGMPLPHLDADLYSVQEWRP